MSVSPSSVPSRSVTAHTRNRHQTRAVELRKEARLCEPELAVPLGRGLGRVQLEQVIARGEDVLVDARGENHAADWCAMVQAAVQAYARYGTSMSCHATHTHGQLSPGSAAVIWSYPAGPSPGRAASTAVATKRPNSVRSPAHCAALPRRTGPVPHWAAASEPPTRVVWQTFVWSWQGME